MNAQNKFCLMVRMVCFESSMADEIDSRRDETIVILATSMAMSEPLPMAMLTSACAMACESLIPSPAIATTFPCS